MVYNPICVSSSLLFIVPMTIAAANRDWISYSILIAELCLALVYHATNNRYLKWADQTAIVAMVVRGFHLASYRGGAWAPMIGCIWGSYVYVYGMYTDTMAFQRDFAKGSLWHATMHAVVSLAGIYMLV